MDESRDDFLTRCEAATPIMSETMGGLAALAAAGKTAETLRSPYAGIPAGAYAGYTAYDYVSHSMENGGWSNICNNINDLINDVNAPINEHIFDSLPPPPPPPDAPSVTPSTVDLTPSSGSSELVSNNVYSYDSSYNYGSDTSTTSSDAPSSNYNDSSSSYSDSGSYSSDSASSV